MSLLDDVEAARLPVGPICGVPKRLAVIDEPFRTEVLDAIENHAIQATALAKVLMNKHGIGLSYFTINRHRRGACSCR